MADKQVTVRVNTNPSIRFQLTSFRNEDAPDTPVNITGYAFRFRARQVAQTPSASIPGGYDTVNIELFDVSGTIVTAASGIFRFDLTETETTFAPGTYVAEIVWWSGGVVTENPTDAWSVDYTIVAKLDSV